ncbi:hypothetical protein E2562_037794 [Oryza meyeriana var. granulata]|uniref:Uncharacterized protein n=1 Tax=Oryza meyeriana var. granulata TaxID=110450 RepID=A0A6G1E8P9_9ORYZ|nr:hypothetical protein E2562_037794 [Oryza meyeriana var. granulata]
MVCSVVDMSPSYWKHTKRIAPAKPVPESRSAVWIFHGQDFLEDCNAYSLQCRSMRGDYDHSVHL